MMFSKRRNALAARAVVASIALSGARALCTSPCYLLYAMSLCFEHSIDWSARGAWHRRNVRDPGLQIPPSTCSAVERPCRAVAPCVAPPPEGVESAPTCVGRVRSRSDGRTARPAPVELATKKFEAKRVVPRNSRPVDGFPLRTPCRPATDGSPCRPGRSRLTHLFSKRCSSSRNYSLLKRSAAEEESRLLVAVTAPKVVDVGGDSLGDGYATISFKTGPNLVSYDYTVSCYERDLLVPTTSCNAIAADEIPVAGVSASGETGTAYDKLYATVTGLGTSFDSPTLPPPCWTLCPICW